jgi:hypothetical protein
VRYTIRTGPNGAVLDRTTDGPIVNLVVEFGTKGRVVRVLDAGLAPRTTVLELASGRVELDIQFDRDRDGG